MGNAGGTHKEDKAKEVKDFEDFLETKGLEAADIITELQRRLDNWMSIPLNIGIIGNSGVGKSTFINTFRGVSQSDNQSAKSGVTQTTMEPTPYEHPEYANVTFWDLPGVGTTDFPTKSYLKKIRFDTYDFFIILCCTRFTENDLWIATQIRSVDKKFYFLRTKTDIDVRNDKDDHPEHSEEQVLKRIKDSCIDVLEKAGFKDPPVFLVCKNPDQYEFRKFEKMAISNLPVLKQEVLLFAARSRSKKIIRARSRRLELRSSLCAAASAALAALPKRHASSKNVDTVIITKELQFYKKMYGLDDEALKQLSSSGRAPEQLITDAMTKRSLVKAGDEQDSSVDGKELVALSWDSLVFNMFEKKPSGRTPVPTVGFVFSAVTSFKKIKDFLGKVREALEEASLSLYTTEFLEASFEANLG